MQLAILAAAFLAGISALFGAVAARVFWAEDLKQAKYIDHIRSETEQHLRDHIETLEAALRAFRQQRDQSK